jgi:hypothetical protein
MMTAKIEHTTREQDEGESLHIVDPLLMRVTVEVTQHGGSRLHTIHSTYIISLFFGPLGKLPLALVSCLSKLHGKLATCSHRQAPGNIHVIYPFLNFQINGTMIFINSTPHYNK